MGLMDGLGDKKKGKLYKLTLKADGKARSFSSTELGKEGMELNHAINILRKNAEIYDKIEAVIEVV